MNDTMAPVRIGVVGAGYVAQLAHLECLRRVEGCVLAGLAELRPALCRAVAEKYDIPLAVETHRDLLSRDDIDAVVVVTRRNATGPVVLDALKAGKHVFAEKPMAHSVARGSELVAAADAEGAVFHVGFMKRHDPGVAIARRKIASLRKSGDAGALLFARCYSHAGTDGRVVDDLLMTDEPRPDGLTLWRTAPDFIPEAAADSFDGFINIHVHIINLARHLLGGALNTGWFDFQPAAVSAAHGSIGGVPCSFEFAARHIDTWFEGIEFFFEKGCLSLRLQPPFDVARSADVIWTDESGADHSLNATPPDVPQWQFQNQAAAFIQAVSAGNPDAAPAHDHLQDLVAIESMWRGVDISSFRSDQT